MGRKMTTKFNDDVNSWFDGVVTMSQSNHPFHTTLHYLALLVTYVKPTKTNYKKLQTELAKHSYLSSVLEFTKMMDAGKYKKEFKYFSEREVSQVSEFFSLFRQACTYHSK